MKKITIAGLILSLSLVFSFGCTENQRVKLYGGTANIQLEKGQKLVNVSWKDMNLWYLTKPMGPNDVAETYTFSQESNFGIIQGEVNIIESK